MCVLGQRVTFGIAMRYWVLILLFRMFATNIFAQEKHVDGIVFDKESKERIAIVNIHKCYYRALGL